MTVFECFVLSTLAAIVCFVLSTLAAIVAELANDRAGLIWVGVSIVWVLLGVAIAISTLVLP